MVLRLPTADDEAALLARAQKGEPDAQSALYRRHASRFLGFLYRLCGDARDAEDVAQDAFVVTFARIDRIEPGRFRAFLYGVGVRKCRNLFRRQRLRRQLGLRFLAPDDSTPEVAQPGVTPEDVAELRRLLAVVRQLPSQERVAWTLKRVEGYTTDEAAELCGCSPATLKRRVSAAQHRLATHVQEARDGD